MPEMNPSVSLMMMARPGEFDCVLRQIMNVTGTEVRSTSDEGRLLVTLVAGDNEELNRRIDILQFVEGLQSSSLTYH